MTDWSERAIEMRVGRRETKEAADALWEKHLKHVVEVDAPQTEQLVAAAMVLVVRAVLWDV